MIELIVNYTDLDLSFFLFLHQSNILNAPFNVCLLVGVSSINRPEKKRALVLGNNPQLLKTSEVKRQALKKSLLTTSHLIN